MSKITEWINTITSKLRYRYAEKFGVHPIFGTVPLTNKEIRRGVNLGLKKYRKHNFLVKYALYMGVAQLLEFGLKKLLEEKYGYDLNRMERWTLGRTRTQLREKGLRSDFISLLDGVVESRNGIAHELLSNEAIYLHFGAAYQKGYYPKAHRFLDKSIFELEQVIFLFDWCNRNNGW